MIAGVSYVFLAFAVLVAYLGFVMSSTAGVGGALILTPVLMMRLPATEAIGIAATVLVANNAFKTVAFRRAIRLWVAGLAAVTALPLAFVGALLTSRVDERVLKLAIAALVLASLSVELWLKRPIPVGKRTLPVLTGSIGFVSGLCSMAGPIAAITFKGFGLSGETFVGTVAIFALGMQVVKIPTYVATGILGIAEWPLVAVFMVTALAGVLTGRRIVRRLDPSGFRRVLNLFLVVIAAVLIYQAV